MVWVRSPAYFYKRKDTFYFSRAVPADLRYRFNKKKVEVSLRTKSEVKAAKSNFKIVIVVDMWLTGFDVPFLDTIYIDKPIQRHT